MKNEPIDSLILNRFKKITRSARIPGGIQFLQGDEEDTVVMKLSPQAMGAALNATKRKDDSNMQTDKAAFEAWALLIHVHCGFRVVLDWTREPEADAYQNHYGRFLYRAMKFAEQYPSWFSLSPALKDRVEDFRMYLRTHRFCNNVSNGEVGTKKGPESRIETLFAGECDKVLTAIGERAGLSLEDSVIHRHLSVGLFEGEKAEGPRVFPGGNAAIDLWTTSGDSIVIFELKVKNSMVGILSELMFYANYMADMFINHNTFTPTPVESESSDRGYEQLFSRHFRQVQAAMLTDQLHSLITPEVLETMNQGASNIQYYNLHYALDENGHPASGDPT